MSNKQTETLYNKDDVFNSHEWQIEQGIRKIVSAVNQTIIVNDQARKERVEEAVRGIIKAYGDQRELEGRESELAGFDNLSWRDNPDIMWSHIKRRKATLTTKKEKE
jgi:hypothetical protein